MIPVKNVYYMLSYAFQALQEKGYRDMAVEQFDNVAELFAAVLIRGIGVQVKRGLGRQYIRRRTASAAVRGRIDISASVKGMTMLKKQLVCSFDEYSVDHKLNQIIKSTAELLRRADISSRRKRQLGKLMVYFDGVQSVDLRRMDWNIRYDRNNQTYRLLIGICYLTVNGLLYTQEDGTVRLMEYLDGQYMHKLYERFILEYYRREHPDIAVSASQIPWALDDGESVGLPQMQSDITLSRGDKVLIVDAKYYAAAAQRHYDALTVRSAHLYQIFTYVKNTDALFRERSHSVSGMLLYAKTDEERQPEGDYLMSGNRISVRMLDLGLAFPAIAAQLDAIAWEYFGSVSRYPRG